MEEIEKRLRMKEKSTYSAAYQLVQSVQSIENKKRTYIISRETTQRSDTKLLIPPPWKWTGYEHNKENR